MKRDIEKFILLFFVCVVPFVVFGQSFRSTYFLEGATYRHRMNPAFMSERNYISIPALGNINSGTQGNVGLTDFIYQYDDPDGKYELTTFMSSTVGRDEFLNKLHDKNVIQMNADLTLLAFGFYGWGGFNTFDLGWHTNAISNMPYELFNFMKTGSESTSGTSYQIRDIRIISNGYAELAFGHARQVNEKLAVGAKLKVLLGGAYADAHIQNMDVSMTRDEWEIIARGTLDVSVSGASFETEEEEKGDKIEGFDVDDTGPNGWGLGVDMGATWQVSDNLTLSGALLDLGFISWENTLKGITLNEPYSFSGFDDIAVKSDDPDDPKDFDEQFDDLGDDLADLANFYDQGSVSGQKRMLDATLNLGGEYKMPFYRKLSAGLLWSTRFNELYTWTEGRLSANIAPVSGLTSP